MTIRTMWRRFIKAAQKDPSREKAARAHTRALAHFASDSRQQQRARAFAREVQRVNRTYVLGEPSVHGFTIPRKARRGIARAWAKQARRAAAAA